MGAGRMARADFQARKRAYNEARTTHPRLRSTDERAMLRTAYRQLTLVLVVVVVTLSALSAGVLML